MDDDCYIELHYITANTPPPPLPRDAEHPRPVNDKELWYCEFDRQLRFLLDPPVQYLSSCSYNVKLIIILILQHDVKFVFGFVAADCRVIAALHDISEI